MTEGVCIRPYTTHVELEAIGVVPWGLNGAYVIMHDYAPSCSDTTLRLQSVGFAAGRVTAREASLSVPCEARAAEVAMGLGGATPRGTQDGRQLLLLIPRYGVIALDATLRSASTRYRLAPGEHGCLVTGSGPKGPLLVSVADTQLVVHYKREPAYDYCLDEAHTSLLFAGLADAALVVTAWRQQGPEPGVQLSVIDPDTTERLRWYALPISPNHRVLSLQRAGDRLLLWLTESWSGAAAARVRHIALSLASGEVTWLPAPQLQVCEPLSLERVGDRPAFLYGVREERAGAYGLVRLDLETGASEVEPSQFGCRLSAPLLAPVMPAASGRAWLLLLRYDGVRDRSELCIRERRNLARPPVAAVQLPSDFNTDSESVWI